MNQQPFSAQSNTISLAVTQVASTPVQLPGRGNAVRIVNEGPNAVFVSITQSIGTAASVPSSAASQGSTPILAGADVTLSMECGAAPNWVSAVCRAGGTATVNFTTGEGI